MATYLQGETGVIPSIQPFDPNINLIANVLQQKDTQFDSNYKQLNKIYNSYVFSDLSRTDNQMYFVRLTTSKGTLVKKIISSSNLSRE